MVPPPFGSSRRSRSSSPRAAAHRKPYATTGGALQLSKVVLYRNGVGYFERGGARRRRRAHDPVRKDQVERSAQEPHRRRAQRADARSACRCRSIRRAWANAAIATLGPGQRQPRRGARHAARHRGHADGPSGGSLSGRIVMVETIAARSPTRAGANGARAGPSSDFKVTLIRRRRSCASCGCRRSPASRSHDGDLALQFQRSLDATRRRGHVPAGRRRRSGSPGKHVARSASSATSSAAPMWKPTYRVVLPEKGKGKALLQGWAVVDNTSGEDWRDVKLALTSGAPIAFRYDLHTPRDVDRADLVRDRHATAARAGLSRRGELRRSAARSGRPRLRGRADAVRRRSRASDGCDEDEAVGQDGARAGRPSTARPRNRRRIGRAARSPRRAATASTAGGERVGDEAPARRRRRARALDAGATRSRRSISGLIALRPRREAHGARRHVDDGRDHQREGRRRGDVPVPAGRRGLGLRGEPVPRGPVQELDAVRARVRARSRSTPAAASSAKASASRSSATSRVDDPVRRRVRASWSRRARSTTATRCGSSRSCAA